MKAKLFALCVVVLLSQLKNVQCDVSEEMMPMIIKCATEMGISIEYLQEHQKPPPDKNCFYKCVAIGMGAMTEAGTEPLDVMKAKFDDHNAPEHIKANLDKCYHVKEDNHCELARLVWECLKTSQ